jgi:hypothetical protein
MSEPETDPFEESEGPSARRHWVLILVASALIVGWGLLIHALVKDGPRQWDFDALPDVPAQSIYSSAPTPEAEAPPRQIAPLPEAKPWKRPGTDDKPAAAGKPDSPKEEGAR